MTTQAACERLASVADFQAAGCECGCALDEDTIGQYLDDASDLAYALSGGAVFGSCQGTLRPCRECWCGSCMGCCEIDAIPLRADTISIDQVKIDGDVLDPANYLLTPRKRLVKMSVDGNRPEPWPYSQRLYLADTEDGTFSITLTFGQTSQPTWVRNAVVELACDMATFFNSARSKLPPSTTAVTYANVSVSLQSRTEALQAGVVGTDMLALGQFLALVGKNRKAWAYSPGGATAWSFPLS